MTNRATMDHPRISSDPEVLLGKPCIVGTRISVQHILNMLAAGSTRSDILDGFEQLSDADISAALWFAADRLGPANRQAAE